ncbi:substrate-binding domain-containing protein [Haloferax volcanii]|uniref:Extracellular solute-binding protein n=2 Tax=Haloferax volcanii TaxID=2246 RepID=A0A8T5CLX9_HALVO|nr:substrate-binding domain-containing protein [Haloferax volcanii]ADE04530.1 ABC-type transport system periplasmic substrate-binding protein (probable substrate sugar) [Haloferax volcanii DS2]MBS8118453.1 extracellular solute-binding protein [Haloferax volcanii]MBS8123466.1 extracellular solute-binding protein [Haloferax volcanii]MBS8127334.1 extracellular solute-binding protein [Haloferax volcanii]MBS8131200.1 extracellular solute-binding protein [Haloferax volcanii]
MVDADSRKGKRNGVSRRSFVKAAGASGVAVGLAGCISTGGGDGDNGDNGSNGGGDSDTSTPINTEETTEDITVKIAGDTRMADNSDAIVQSMRDAGLPDNISIDIIAGSQVTDNRQAQYQQWLGGGREEPTLLMMDSGWTIPFIARNQLQNLSESLPSEMISTIEDEYFEASVSTAKGSNGDLYGVPLFPDFPTMQYRKDLLRNAGYTDDDFDTWATESMSWEEFSKVTKEALDANDVQYGYTFQADVYEGLSCCDFNEFMTSYGGAFFGGRDNLFGPVGERPITVDEQSVLDSIRMVRTLIHGEDDEYALDGITGGIAPEAVLQWTEEPSRKPFTGGDAIMHRNWPYSITINGADDVFGEDLGVMPIPYGVPADEAKYEGTGGPVAALGGWHMTMNPNAPQQQKQAGAQVLEVMMKPQFQLDNFGIQGWIPPRPELLDSEEAKNVDVIGRYLSALKVAGNNAIPRPVTVVWPQQSGKVAQEVNNAYAQEKTPEQAMSDLKSQLEAIEQSLA